MKSQYIPKKQIQEEPSLMERIKAACFGSIYIGNLKITLDAVGGPMYKLGITLTPRYKQLEFNLGKLALVFWYREMM